MARIRFSRLRVITMLFFFGLAAIGLAFKTGIGTLCDLGYGAISAICPLGALETALAGRTFPARTLVSLAVVVVIVAALGRFFCAWICPAPILRGWILRTEQVVVVNGQGSEDAVNHLGGNFKNQGIDDVVASLKSHQRLNRKLSLDSRHFILGGALLSSAIFGFPVFCLVCPVGLILATFIGTWRLFQFNEPSWMLLVFPVIFIIEIVVCRKWCRKICPLGALLSILSGLNRSFRPRVNHSLCRSVSQKMDCAYCKNVCDENINLHNSEQSRPIAECTKCRECADVCPAGAISFPLFSKKRE